MTSALLRDVVLDRHGQGIAAEVEVLDPDTELAVEILDAAGDPIPQPIVANVEGEFAFYTADPQRVLLRVSSGTATEDVVADVLSPNPPASSIVVDPFAGVAATNLQAALEEVYAESGSGAVATHVGLADPHTQYQLKSQKGAAGGYASLDLGGKVPTTELPALAISETFVVNSQAAMLALTAERGDVAVRTDSPTRSFILTTDDPTQIANWQELLTPADAVSSFNGRTGAVMPAQADYDSFFTTPAEAAAAAPVQSVFGRTGAVVAEQGDYDGFFTTPAEAAAAAPVQSVFGRTGAVTALQADYDGFFLTPTEGDAAYLARAGLTDGSVLFVASTQVAQDNANFFWDDPGNRLIVGPRGTGTYEAVLNAVETGSAARRGVSSYQASADTREARFVGRKSRGTPSAPTIVGATDILASLVAFGYDGANFLESGAVRIAVDNGGAPVATRIGTKIVFATATDAAPSVLTDRWQIGQGGNLNPLGTVNTLDIGGSAATARTVYAGTSFIIHDGTTARARLLPASLLFLGAGAAIGTDDSNKLTLRTNATGRWEVGASTGHFQAATDNTYDFGTNSTLRPRTMYLATSLVFNNATNAVEDIIATTTGGVRIGATVSEKWAFHGATPVIQRAGAAQAAVATTAATNVTPWGFSTQAQADALVTLANEMRQVLVEKGLMKGAA